MGSKRRPKRRSGSKAQNQSSAAAGRAGPSEPVQRNTAARWRSDLPLYAASLTIVGVVISVPAYLASDRQAIEGLPLTAASGLLLTFFSAVSLCVLRLKSPVKRETGLRRTLRWSPRLFTAVSALLVGLSMLWVGSVSTVLPGLFGSRSPAEGRASAPLRVVVADFSSPRHADDIVSHLVKARLAAATAGYHDVSLQLVPNSFSASTGDAGPRQFGQRRHADLVIWGWYDESRTSVVISTNFLLLRRPPDLQLRQPGIPRVVPIRQLDHFSLQTDISRQMSYLVTLASAVIEYEEGRYRDAIPRLQRAIELTPVVNQLSNPDVPYRLLGLSYGEVGNHKQALSELEAGQRVNWRDYGLTIDLGLAYYLRGRPHAALQEFSTAISLRPRNPEGYVYRAWFFEGIGQFARMLRDYKHALKIKKVYDAEVNLAAYYDYMRQENLASKYVNAVFRSKKVDYFAYAVRADIRDNIGDHTGALQDYNRAIKLNRKDAGSYNGRGSAYNEQGNYSVAIKDFDRAIQLYGSDAAPVYINRAEAYSNEGDYKRALLDYASAIRAARNSYHPYYYRGRLELNLNEYQHARADFSHTLKLTTHLVGAFEGLGEADFHLRRYGEAIWAFENALSLNANYAKALANLGVTLAAIGHDAQAIRDLRKAAALLRAQGDMADYQRTMEALARVER